MLFSVGFINWTIIAQTAYYSSVMSAYDLQIQNEEAEVLNLLEGRYDPMVDRLLSWSKINSGSRNRDGLDKMRTALIDKFEALPGKITTPPLTVGEYVTPKGLKQPLNFAPAMLLTVRPKAPIQLVLTGHYDTVFPAESHFQTPEYLDDETVNGPGVADMKGGILVMAEALAAFENSKNKDQVGYNVLLSPDEEIGSPGSSALLHKLGTQSHVGLTFEPALADGSMAGARKGSGNFALIIRGKAAHAGREHHLGRNAISAMSEFTVALDQLNGQREGVTFNMAKIDGGGALNVVPDLAIGRFNVRMQETEDMGWIREQIDTIIGQINAKDGITAELTGDFTRPPKPMAPANAMIFDWVKRAGDLLGQKISWNPSGGVCEGNNLWASGCPNVDTLGVRGGDIHSDREYIKLPSLIERSKLTTLILMKIASGEFDAQKAKALARSESHSC